VGGRGRGGGREGSVTPAAGLLPTSTALVPAQRDAIPMPPRRRPHGGQGVTRGDLAAPRPCRDHPGFAQPPRQPPHTPKPPPAPARPRSLRPHEPGQGLARSAPGTVPPWEAVARRRGRTQLETFWQSRKSAIPAPDRGTAGPCCWPQPRLPLARAHGRPRHGRNALAKPPAAAS